MVSSQSSLRYPLQRTAFHRFTYSLKIGFDHLCFALFVWQHCTGVCNEACGPAASVASAGPGTCGSYWRNPFWRYRHPPPRHVAFYSGTDQAAFSAGVQGSWRQNIAPHNMGVRLSCFLLPKIRSSPTIPTRRPPGKMQLSWARQEALMGRPRINQSSTSRNLSAPAPHASNLSTIKDVDCVVLGDAKCLRFTGSGPGRHMFPRGTKRLLLGAGHDVWTYASHWLGDR